MWYSLVLVIPIVAVRVVAVPYLWDGVVCWGWYWVLLSPLFSGCFVVFVFTTVVEALALDVVVTECLAVVCVFVFLSCVFCSCTAATAGYLRASTNSFMRSLLTSVC